MQLRWRIIRKQMIFNVYPEGSRTRGRPRSRWWDCVQQDLKDLRIRNWEDIGLAKDRDK